MPDNSLVEMDSYIAGFSNEFPEFATSGSPWAVVPMIGKAVLKRLTIEASGDFVGDDGIAVHREAEVESGAVLKAPVLIMAGAFVAAYAYLRGGVILGREARVGPGCEVKASIVGEGSTLAHFNFVGDSILGHGVNLEAGAVVANHFNERSDKSIFVRVGNRLIDTGTDRFGALIGDNCRIGANAVLSPGTLLPPDSCIGRLELVEPASP